MSGLLGDLLGLWLLRICCRGGGLRGLRHVLHLRLLRRALLTLQLVDVILLFLDGILLLRVDEARGLAEGEALVEGAECGDEGQCDNDTPN